MTKEQFAPAAGDSARFQSILARRLVYIHRSLGHFSLGGENKPEV